VVVVTVAALSGCTRLNHSQTVSLAPGHAEAVFALPIPTSDEKITVTATSPGAPVALFLVPTDSVNTALDVWQLKKKIDDEKIVRAKTEIGESVTLEATLHANDDLNLIVACGDKEAKEIKIVVIGK
jgi:hypothetical protein